MNEVKQFLVRHSIAAPVSFVTWLYLLLSTSLGFTVVTAISIVLYVGGNFVMKQIQVSSNYKQLGMSRSEYKHVKKQLYEAKQKLHRLNSLYGQVRSIQAFRQLYEMINFSKRIVKIVKMNPQKFYDAENFFYAHLDSAVELSTNYVMLINQPLKDTELKIALQNTRETLSDVNDQLQNDLRRVLSSDIEKLQLERDFVDITINKNKNKPLLNLKGDTKK